MQQHHRLLLILTSALLLFTSFATQAALPRGTYKHSCSQCRVVDGTLSCACHTRDQHVRHSELPQVHRCHRVQNNNGSLHCVANRHLHVIMSEGNVHERVVIRKGNVHDDVVIHKNHNHKVTIHPARHKHNAKCHHKHHHTTSNHKHNQDDHRHYPKAKVKQSVEH